MTDDGAMRQRALYLAKVDKLSGKQIQKTLGIGYRRLKKILSSVYPKSPVPQVSCVQPYRHLVARWYEEHPHLKAKQIFERLKSYGFKGSYASAQRFTLKYRRKKTRSYLVLDFLPGEEAQIDWFFYKTPEFGQVAGFLYLLSYSRYAWGGFYPRTAFEFFIQAHLEAFEHLKGHCRSHRYDNLKSVVLKRKPQIEYNPRFLDFAHYHGFKIHACNPSSGNEKGRVERLIRDIRAWAYGRVFATREELNEAFRGWLTERKLKIHRSTGKSPLHLLADEKLMELPQEPYPAQRIVPAMVSKTAFVEFETNRYSTPSWCASKPCEMVIGTRMIGIFVDKTRAASHRRCFERGKIIAHPLHTEKSPREKNASFKMNRIFSLVKGMEPEFNVFLSGHETEAGRLEASYEIFGLLKSHNRRLLVSAVGELNRLKCFKAKALKSLLGLPSPREEETVLPQDPKLLNLKYDERSLKDYDPY